MELIDTHITFFWEELREAARDGSIDRLFAQVSAVLDYGYGISVNNPYGLDISFASVDELKEYIETLSWELDAPMQAEQPE